MVGGRMNRLDLEVALDGGPLLLDVSAGAPMPLRNDIGAGAGKGARIRQSNAAGRAGHNCGLACQCTHFHLLLFAAGGFGGRPP